MSSAKKDVEALMNEFIGLAKRMLSEFGEFHPYGAAMKPNGELVSIAVHDGDEHSPSQSTIDVLNDEFEIAARSGEYIATALFYDVRVALRDKGPKSDAVAVALDHRDDYSVVVFFPYQIEDGKVSFGELFAQQGANNIFRSLH